MIIQSIGRSALVGALLAIPVALSVAAEAPSDKLAAFEARIAALGAERNLPGFSAAVVRDQELIWARGFGFADIEKKRRARPDTPYRLASLSKPLAAVVLMQLVEEGALSLDDPMKNFVIHSWFEPGGGSWAHYPSRYQDKPITIRHVLTHTSQSDPPGEAYAYNGNIFADLTWVIEDVTDRSYPRVLEERVLSRAGMKRSLAGQMVPTKQKIAREIARPYKVEGGRAVPSTYPGFGIDPAADVGPWNLEPAYRLPAASYAARRARLGAAFTSLYSSQTAAGVVSTVEDLARFDIALDRGELVSARSRAQMFSASTSADGRALPYGLGWFIEDHDGMKVVWHYGWFPPTISALYIKVPERGVSFIVLANSDGISAGEAWTAEGVRTSPFARAFLHAFAGEE